MSHRHTGRGPRLCLIALALGATATANRRFSDGSAIARALGARWVDAAIAWAAARTPRSHLPAA